MACPGIPKRNISQRFIPQNKRIEKNAKNDVHISNEIIVKFVRLLNHTELNTSQTTSAAGIANTNESNAAFSDSDEFNITNTNVATSATRKMLIIVMAI